MVGQVMWELIEPLDDESVYARFLAEKGDRAWTRGGAGSVYAGSTREPPLRGLRELIP
jgi:hypothetical protein